MKEMLTWEKIQEKYKDQWVAFTEWEEDEQGDVVKGCVAYSNPSQNAFYQYLKTQMRPKIRKIATRYTGNVRGPFFLGS